MRITSRILVFSLLSIFCAAQPQNLFAQGNSLFSSSGLTKGGTGGISGALGGSGFGSMTGGASSAASGISGLGGAAGGLGGSSGLGGRGASGATAGGLGMGANALGGTNAGGFVGRNGTTMAGNAQAGQTAGGSRSTSRSANRSNGMTSNRQGEQSDFNNGGAQQKVSKVRPRQRVAFEFNSKSPAKVAATMTTRLERIGLKNPSLKQVGIQMVGDEIVLSGRVKTADQSKLAENLLRLEPGVKSIRNELEIDQVSTIE